MHTSKLRFSSSPPGFVESYQATTFLYPFRLHVLSRKLTNPSMFTSLKCMDKEILEPLQNHPFLLSCSLTVSDRVKCLASEFKSLTEPIDRVKKLLHYATLLPPFEDSAKNEENRVKGCTAQVWLEVKMDNDGLLRFRVDSDSEITKGFCSCLIAVLDGGEPEEILSLKIDDLFDMNVGMPSRGNSRVNTWQNVLISMQKRTKDVIIERDRIKSLDTSFSSLLVKPNCINGSCKEAQL